MNSSSKKFVIFIILVSVIFLLVNYFDIFNLADYLNPFVIKEKISSWGVWGPILFMLAYAVATILFLPTPIFSIAGGISFGIWLGTLYVVIGATTGALISFIFSRYFGKQFIENLLEKKWHKISDYNQKLEKRGFLTTLFLRLIPLFPFNGVNLALGTTKVKLRDYLLGTLIGIVPGSFIYVGLGNAFTSAMLWQIILSIVLLLLLVSILPIYNKIKRSNQVDKISNHEIKAT